MENTGKNKTVKTENDTQEKSVENLLAFAVHTMYEVISCRAPEYVINNFEATKKIYYDLRYSVSADDHLYQLGATGNESVDKMINAAMENMFAHYKVLASEESISNEKSLKLFSIVKETLQEAVEASKTKEELEKCADTIEVQLNNKKWADEIRKDIYADDWIPGAPMIQDTESTSDEYNKYVASKSIKKDTTEYFTNRMPAAYAEYLKKQKK